MYIYIYIYTSNVTINKIFFLIRTKICLFTTIAAAHRNVIYMQILSQNPFLTKSSINHIYWVRVAHSSSSFIKAHQGIEELVKEEGEKITNFCSLYFKLV